MKQMSHNSSLLSFREVQIKTSSPSSPLYSLRKSQQHQSNFSSLRNSDILQPKNAVTLFTQINVCDNLSILSPQRIVPIAQTIKKLTFDTEATISVLHPRVPFMKQLSATLHGFSPLNTSGNNSKPKQQSSPTLNICNQLTIDSRYKRSQSERKMKDCLWQQDEKISFSKSLRDYEYKLTPVKQSIEILNSQALKKLMLTHETHQLRGTFNLMGYLSLLQVLRFTSPSTNKATFRLWDLLLSVDPHSFGQHVQTDFLFSVLSAILSTNRFGMNEVGQEIYSVCKKHFQQSGPTSEIQTKEVVENIIMIGFIAVDLRAILVTKDNKIFFKTAQQISSDSSLLNTRKERSLSAICTQCSKENEEKLSDRQQKLNGNKPQSCKIPIEINVFDRLYRSNSQKQKTDIFQQGFNQKRLVMVNQEKNKQQLLMRPSESTSLKIEKGRNLSDIIKEKAIVGLQGPSQQIRIDLHQNFKNPVLKLALKTFSPMISQSLLLKNGPKLWKQKPLFRLGVEVAKGKSAKITVYEDDDVNKIVESFGKAFSLNKQSTRDLAIKIYGLIEDYHQLEKNTIEATSQDIN